MDINTYPYNCEPYKCEPYKCETCNYVTLVKKNLLWHNSLESHLYRVRNIKPTAVSIFKEIKNLSNEERDKLLKYINDFDFIKN
jgi:hypothetical protein